MHYMSIFRRGVARSRGTPRRRGAFRALLKKLDAKPEIVCLNLPYKTPKHKVMPPRCLPLRAACGEKLTYSACVSRAARDDRIMRETRASRVGAVGVARRTRSGGAALWRAVTNFRDSSLSLMSKQSLMDRFASSDFRQTSEIRMEVSIARMDHPSALFIRGRSRSDRSGKLG